MKISKIFAVALAALLSVSVTACDNGGSAQANAEIRTVSSNEKIMLDKEIPDGVATDDTLRFVSAKGEYESAQIIVTPDRDVSGVDLRLSDLKCGKDVISASNIQVYYEKYLRLDAMSSPLYQGEFGCYPDALVPLKNVKEKGEDRIAKGNNQGLWVTVKVPSDAEAGTYAGSFVLAVGGKEYNVPVELKVWDFLMPQETHMQTIFNNFREHLMNGELDNSEEMFKFYSDWLLDYHISVDRLPLFERDTEKMVELAKEYAANPKCACYGLNLYFVVRDVTLDDNTVKSVNDTDWDAMKEYIVALAEASTTELNLLKKLNVYDQSIDEPEGTGRVQEANYKQKKVNELKREIIDQLKAENFDFAAHGVAEEDILAIEYVVTNRYAENLKDMTTYCPTINELNSEPQRKKYEELEKRSPYNTTWWYDAWQPQYPYPNFRVEESSVGLRVMCWMQMDYGIDGFLYWGTSVYAGIESNGFGSVRDPYTDPYPFEPERVTDDGQLTYPGRPYGVYGPVPSIRLMAYRDGAEDYEYLWYLRSLLGEANDAYATNFDFNAMMSSVYDSLYSGTIPNYSAAALEAARAEVASLIELLESEAKAVINIDRIDATANEATYSVYTTSDTVVTAEDATKQSEELQGKSGKKYVFKQNMDKVANYAEITFRTGAAETKVSKYLGKKVNVINLFDGETAKFTVSNGNVLNPQNHIVFGKGNDGIENLGENAAKLVISPYTAGTPTQIAAYSPYIEIAKSNFGGLDGTLLDEIGFTLYGADLEGKSVRLILVAGGTTYSLGSRSLVDGINVIRFDQVYSSSWNKLSEVTAIRIVFDKAENRSDTIYIDELFYTSVA